MNRLQKIGFVVFVVFVVTYFGAHLLAYKFRQDDRKDFLRKLPQQCVDVLNTTEKQEG